MNALTLLTEFCKQKDKQSVLNPDPLLIESPVQVQHLS